MGEIGKITGLGNISHIFHECSVNLVSQLQSRTPPGLLINPFCELLFPASGKPNTVKGRVFSDRLNEVFSCRGHSRSQSTSILF